jgi:hypothetical protein
MCATQLQYKLQINDNEAEETNSCAMVKPLVLLKYRIFLYTRGN